MQTTMKHLMGALNSFVFAVGLSALGKKKKIHCIIFNSGRKWVFSRISLKNSSCVHVEAIAKSKPGITSPCQLNPLQASRTKFLKKCQASP